MLNKKKLNPDWADYKYKYDGVVFEFCDNNYIVTKDTGDKNTPYSVRDYPIRNNNRGKYTEKSLIKNINGEYWTFVKRVKYKDTESYKKYKQP